MRDVRTKNLNLPLPNGQNRLEEDIGRLVVCIELLDKVASSGLIALTTEEAARRAESAKAAAIAARNEAVSSRDAVLEASGAATEAARQTAQDRAAIEGDTDLAQLAAQKALGCSEMIEGLKDEMYALYEEMRQAAGHNLNTVYYDKGDGVPAECDENDVVFKIKKTSSPS